MPIYRAEDIIAWEDGSKIYCVECGDPGDAKPLTKADFNDDDVVICDECDEHMIQ